MIFIPTYDKISNSNHQVSNNANLKLHHEIFGGLLPMPFSIIPDDEALSNCACWQKVISDETDIVDFGIQVKPDVDLSDYRSHCIEIQLTSKNRPVHMMVTAARSDAKKEGKDGLFLLCSQACANEFKQTLQAEIDQGKLIESIKS